MPTIVVKVGGRTMEGDTCPSATLNAIRGLWDAGWRVVVVHGGGLEISRWSERTGLTPRFVDGLRYSDPDTVTVVSMVLAGRVGKALVSSLVAAGLPAISLAGVDAGLLQAAPLEGTGPNGRTRDLGLVGRVSRVDLGVLESLHQAGFLPLIAPVAPGPGGEVYNINADDAAADIATALGADVLCLATDVPGVLIPGDVHPLRVCTAEQAHSLIREGIVRDGMRPKVEACLRAVLAGVGRAWIVDGAREGSILGAAKGDSDAGTAFVSTKGDSRPVAPTPVPELDRAFLMQNYSRFPVVLVRGRGRTVWDDQGRPYLDFLSGISVTNVGHCHPRVVAAIMRQARTLAHTSNFYHTRPQAELAALLNRLAFAGHVFFCNSGTEANEGALKLARKAAWRRAEVTGRAPALEVVCFDHSFHGRTYGSMAVTSPAYQQGFGPMLDGFRQLPWNDVDAVERAIGPQTAGVIVEPIQGEGGVRPASVEFLRTLRRLCDLHGACLIFDEVQCGLGRAGTMFAYQRHGIVPDVLTLGKALGAGLPMGALLAAGEWAQALRPGDHASTFGGNPVVAAAALAGLEALEREGLPAHAMEMGERLQGAICTGISGSRIVREVRGVGLMIGVELTVPGKRAVDFCRDEGLLINCTAERVLRVMPALNVTAEEVDRAGQVIVRAIARLEA